MPRLKHIKGYKGFNEDWSCKGMKYVVGKTHTGGVVKV
jgi:hypothetical protein